MNSIDKIKALLESPGIHSVTVLCDHGTGMLSSVIIHDRVQLNYALFNQGGVDYFEVNYFEWPELGIGDTVMTKHGEGVIETILLTGEYTVRLSNCGPAHFNLKCLPRHEIALLQKAEA